MAKQTPNAADYIKPLNMNGLQGRMINMPAPKGQKPRDFDGVRPPFQHRALVRFDPGTQQVWSGHYARPAWFWRHG